MKKTLILLSILGIVTMGTIAVVSCGQKKEVTQINKNEETDLSKIITDTTINLRSGGNAYEIYSELNNYVSTNETNNTSFKTGVEAWQIDNQKDVFFYIINKLNKTTFDESLNQDNKDIVWSDISKTDDYASFEPKLLIKPAENSKYTGYIIVTVVLTTEQ